MNKLRKGQNFKHEIKWKYLINLCGEDLPLKTNYEIISYLKSIEPANSIEGSRLPERKEHRYMYKWQIGEGYDKEYKKEPILPGRFAEKKLPPPGNMTLYAGLAYLLATREFIDWALNDEYVKEVIEWSKDTFSPDEMLWASIARLESAPGGVAPINKVSCF